MKPVKCIPQQIYKLVLGIIVLINATVLFVLGLTLLPVLGILLSLPTYAAAYYILNLNLTDKCEIKFT